MKKIYLIIAAMAFFAFFPALCQAELKKGQDETLRRANGVFDLQRNTLSAFDFMLTNYGIMGMDIAQGAGSGVWPRGSMNLYLFGSGFWFGAKKQTPDGSGERKYVELSYNPNNGRSWFVPGSIEDGDSLNNDLIDKNRLYFSTDFNSYSGRPFFVEDGPNWPLWIDDTLMRYQYGTYRHSYVNDVDDRNRASYPYGPMFVSGEDIVSVFKDTDLSFFDGGETIRRAQGYPLRLQAESRIYTWDNEEMKDVVIHSYLIHNMSDDTLRDCWFAGVYDVDLAHVPNAHEGAANDRAKYFDDDSTLNLAVAWTDTDQGEAGRGFGYIGISLLETPAIDANGFIRNDMLIFEPDEQIGIQTFVNWSIANDVYEDDARYDFISMGVFNRDNGPGDTRMLIATGPFNMRPGDVARVVFNITFALPAKGGEADGTYEDLTGFKDITHKDGKPQTLSHNNSLIGKIQSTKEKYYQTNPSAVIERSAKSGLSLNAVYPNPLVDCFTTCYAIKKSGCVRLSLFDQLGREALVLDEGPREAGAHYVRFSIDKKTIPNGIYYLRLLGGAETITRKIVVAR